MALALAAGAVLLAGAASIGKGRFTELDVERINLREADGTIGMVIANRERLPGLYLRTTEHAHDRGGDKSGMLLFNDVTDGVQPPVLSGQDKAANAAGDYAITPRVLLGKSGSQNAALLLNDGNGPPPLQLEVTPDGQASVVFLDEDGKTVHGIAPAAG